MLLSRQCRWVGSSSVGRTFRWGLGILATALISLPVTAHADLSSEDLPEGIFETLPDQGPKLPDEWAPAAESNTPAPPGKRVAIYVDNGVWDMGENHFKRLLTSAGYAYKTLSARDIQAGQLTLENYDVLLMPGGKSWIYLDDLGPTGAQAIREFVNAGGSYFGTCAGAFYATSLRKDRNRDNIPYGIGLLEGTAYDGTSLGTRPFISGMMNIDYHLKNFKQDYRVLLLGGPAFIYSAEEARKKNIRVLATFEGFGKPAMITFNYGQGRVALAGPHGEIEESQAYFGLKWRDPDSEWPILKAVLAYLKGGPEPELRSKSPRRQ